MRGFHPCWHLLRLTPDVYPQQSVSFAEDHTRPGSAGINEEELLVDDDGDLEEGRQDDHQANKV